MLKTIKGRLTVSVICIVAASILFTTMGITIVAGKRMIKSQTQALQLNADKYAEEINTWIENEKMLADGAANSIESSGKTDTDFIQSVVDIYSADRKELLNLYCGTKDSRFIQSNREAEIPDGYDPVQRGWYKQAAEKGTVVVTDPYWDVMTNQMCTTIAAPVYIDNELAGVIGLDVTLETVTELTGSISYEEGVYGFLADSSDHYVAHKNKKYEPTEDSAVAVADIMPGLKKMIEGTESSVRKLKDYDGKSCYFAVSEIEGSDWKLLEFMNGRVMEDYKGMTELAKMYQKDAEFYNEISVDLGASSEEMSNSMVRINESILAITKLVGEIAEFIESMKQSAEDSNENSGAVVKQMEELFRLSELLNKTVASFKV